MVLLAGAPSAEDLSLTGSLPVLVVQGTRDGVVRFSEFAVSRHRAMARRFTHVHFVAVPGAAHHSFTSVDTLSPLTAEVDLRPLSTQSDTHANVSAIVEDWILALPTVHGGALETGQVLAQLLSDPMTAALELEGSTALGHVSFNSDFPTNPKCNYPKFPDHSLPPGAHPAPSPPLPSDCICGSPWVAKHAAPVVAGFDMSKDPSFTVTAKDAYQDVSDVHPFHLPHIWSSCEEGATTCELNTTTLTMPISKAGDLFPSKTSPPKSLFEFRSKLKSRVATWEAAGLGKQSGDLDTKNVTMCRTVNQMAYDWALAHAEESVRKDFLAHGEPFVMVDDKEATIGATGPEWIKDELVYKRVQGGANGGARIEIQSWKFVVGNTNEGHVPWFIPAGMHYCKLLSPARAMEWIYTDGLRANLHA